MALSIEEVEKIANLARLEISEQEKIAYGESLEKIIAWVEQMNQAPTNDLKPMAHPLEMAQPLREDEVKVGNLRDELLDIAPKTEAGLYLVPKVIE